MNNAYSVQHVGQLKGSNVLRSLLFVFLAIGLMSCANQNVKYLSTTNEVQDVNNGFSGSEARLEVPSNVSISAETVHEEDMGLLRTEVMLTNASQRQIRLLYRGCPVQLLVFDNEKREGEPLFDSFDAYDAPGHDCQRREVVRTLFALEDLYLTEVTHVDKVFTDGNFGGTYYLTAVVRPNGIPMEVPAGVVEL